MKTESILRRGLVSSNSADKFSPAALSNDAASALAAYSLDPLKFIPVNDGVSLGAIYGHYIALPLSRLRTSFFSIVARSFKYEKIMFKVALMSWFS